jgi:4-hydroxy-tetrahydrodipicolinate reductase
MATGKPLVIGTTGHSEEERQQITSASHKIPILYSPNFSLGIALCLKAVAKMGAALYGSSTIDIIETHHLHKKDIPSGTSCALADAIHKGKAFPEGSSARERDKQQIVIHSIRSGEVTGEHTVIFECGHERIELKHIAHSRDAFAHGALLGARFLARQPPGLYSIRDLFQHDQ